MREPVNIPSEFTKYFQDQYNWANTNFIPASLPEGGTMVNQGQTPSSKEPAFKPNFRDMMGPRKIPVDKRYSR